MRRKGISLLFVAILFFMMSCGKKTENQDTGSQNTGTQNTEIMKEIYQTELPTTSVDAEIYVEKIEGISDEFIRGVDISSIISLEKSGVIFYDEAGNSQDIFKTLRDSGVNYVRVRVWNDPYDQDGNGYGGGNCDTKTAAEIGKRAAQYGIKLLVNYHYSDFWADPAKQKAPKAWEELTLEEKEQEIYSFTKESLSEIINAGSEVAMVQIGNETNNGMAGETKKSSIAKLMNKASLAVREIQDEHSLDIKIAVHLTNAEDIDGIDSYMATLKKFKVDYDVMGISYYPYWHGTLENLSNLMDRIIEKYQKEVMVAETSYAYTLEDGDGHPNSVNEKDLNSNYAASVQSQSNVIRDVCATVASKGEYGLGVFYWEPAWIPVQVYDYDLDTAEEVLSSNKNKWEEFGTGWASSYAGSYDSEDAGQYYGGSSWDNQALFDFLGHPLPSLSVFKYLKYGTNSDLKADFIKDVKVDINLDAPLTMPETVYVVYNNRDKSTEVPVTWNQELLSTIDTSIIADYVIDGVTADGDEVFAQLHIAHVNFIQNADFEGDDFSAYKIIYDETNPADFLKKEADAYSGSTSLHYWNLGEVYFQAEQNFDDLNDGTYYFSMYGQGGNQGAEATFYIYATSGDVTYTTEFTVNGYAEWVMPEIKDIKVVDHKLTVGVYVKAGEGAWGTFDDWYLCKTD